MREIDVIEEWVRSKDAGTLFTTRDISADTGLNTNDVGVRLRRLSKYGFVELVGCVDDPKHRLMAPYQWMVL